MAQYHEVYQRLMAIAVEQADKSKRRGGIPIGACLATAEGTPISLGHNMRYFSNDPLCHSGAVCIRNAGRRDDWSTSDFILAQTVAPSMMDAGLIDLYGIKTVVIGYDMKYPGVASFLREAGVKVVPMEDQNYIKSFDSWTRQNLDKWKPDIAFREPARGPRSGGILEAVPENRQMPILQSLLSAAIEQAKQSLHTGGIPIGACLADASGTVVALGHNQRVQNEDTASHAATMCIRNAGHRDDWGELTLITTLSPSQMDAGVIQFLGIRNVVIVYNKMYSDFEPWLVKHGVRLNLYENEEYAKLIEAYRVLHPEHWIADSFPAGTARKSAFL